MKSLRTPQASNTCIQGTGGPPTLWCRQPDTAPKTYPLPCRRRPNRGCGQVQSICDCRSTSRDCGTRAAGQQRLWASRHPPRNAPAHRAVKGPADDREPPPGLIGDAIALVAHVPDDRLGARVHIQNGPHTFNCTDALADGAALTNYRLTRALPGYIRRCRVTDCPVQHRRPRRGR